MSSINTVSNNSNLPQSPAENSEMLNSNIINIGDYRRISESRFFGEISGAFDHQYEEMAEELRGYYDEPDAEPYTYFYEGQNIDSYNRTDDVKFLMKRALFLSELGLCGFMVGNFFEADDYDQGSLMHIKDDSYSFSYHPNQGMDNIKIEVTILSESQKLWDLKVIPLCDNARIAA